MQQPELGNKIISLRKQKGFTQEELVERCNINVRTLQRIESGEVSPRSYTIKTILSALDYDYEELYGEENTTAKDSIILSSKTEVKSVRFLLTLAAISGILYLLIGPFEAFSDYYRFGEEDVIFSLGGHVFIKIVSYLSYALFIYGFLIVGKLYQNYLMKIAVVLLISVLFLFYTYDIISMYYESVFPIEGILVAQSIIVGTLGLFFGISIMKSAKEWGVLGYAAGGLELFTAFCFLIVILVLVGLVTQFPTVIVEVVLLVKLRQKIKS